jgi:two-component system, sensor histidine kinase LadS
VRFLFLLFFSSYLYASSSFLSGPVPYQLFEDTQSLSLEQLDSRIIAAPMVHGRRSLGYSSSVFWLRLVLSNTSELPQTRWLDLGAPRLQSVTLYIRQNGRWQASANAGLDTPRSMHPVKAKHAVFALQLAAGEQKEVLIRVSGKTSMSLAPFLATPQQYMQHEVSDSMWLGGLLGLFVIVMLNCLLLFVFIRDVSFLYHGLAIIFLALNEISMRGYGALYLWPESTVWSVHSLSFFGQICSLFFLLFVRNFLNLAEVLPWADKVTRLTMIWIVCAVLISQAVDYQRGTIMGLLLAFITEPILLLICFQLLSKGALAMRFFCAGVLIVLTGHVFNALNLFGLLSGGLPLGEHILLLFIIFSMLSFFIAILDRMMLAKKEKENAQKALIDTLNSQHLMLEQAVENRTAALKAAAEEAQSANQLKTKLLAYIGHDLRAPLATMIAYAKNMRKGEGDFSAVIERSAGQQLELIDELLQYAKGEIVNHNVQLNAGHFGTFIADIQTQARLLAGQYQNRFIFLQQGYSPDWLYADWKRLRQVLQNLLSNSAKFTRYGVISLTLKWQTDAEQASLLTVVVEDTGVGMNQTDHQRVFLPFERVEQSELQEGHGLGLAIASQMVKSMGGELQVESAMQLGSRFYFCLRLAHAKEVVAPPLSVQTGPELPAAAVQQLHCLIAGGQVSEIEDWAEKIAGLSPKHAHFAQRLNEALYALDFDTLQALAANLAAVPASSPVY